MSRAYKIRVSESLRRVIRGSDHVCTRLEILNVLPEEEMSALLAEHLQKRGFTEKNGKMVRQEGDVEILIDPADAVVTVQISSEEEIHLEGKEEGWGYVENDKQARSALQDSLKGKLEKDADAKQAVLQTELTNKLEASLSELRRELDQVANQVTADALKKKAARMGQIKEVSEDPESGSMTIVLEV